MSDTAKFAVVDAAGATPPAPPGDACCQPCEFGLPQNLNGHPAWYPAKANDEGYCGLKVNNSVCGGLVDFRPMDGKKILWYTCGPTVYDHSHMGHARAYLTFDIIRRVMEDYFHYQILYHSNITDIDDKIILKARRNKLVGDYTEENKGAVFANVVKYTDEAMATTGTALQAKLAGLQDAAKGITASRDKEDNLTAQKGAELKISQFKATQVCYELAKLAEKSGIAKAVEQLKTGKDLAASLVAVDEKLFTLSDEDCKGAKAEAANRAAIDAENNLKSKLQALEKVESLGAVAAVISICNDPLGEALDKEKGHTVTDHAVFDAHCRKYEQSFLDDMRALGVQDPDVLTRVTEYVPEIVDFVKKIVDKGLAYASNGSVYLDTEAFKKSGHNYRKNVPFAGDTSAEMMAESEGALGGAQGSEKKHPNDFALWKASKRGEPFWASPWGEGRPGWHIECSVVASDILGANMDIHAGGCDLKFPHHDNELAQSEAYHGNQQWVNYFLHCGHLHIKGLKMSKSLKNFITIKQALKEHSARQLRIMFLLQQWDRPMNYSDQTVSDARTKEALFKNFFGAVKALVRTDWLSQAVGYRNPAEDRALAEAFLGAQKSFDVCLKNNFDTPGAITALTDLVSHINKYLEKPNSCVMLVHKAAMYITKMLRMLGVVEGQDDIGFPVGGAGGGNVEQTVTPYVDAIVAFRDQIRAMARDKADHVDFLKACDEIRDNALVDIGVALEDKADGPTIWKMSDPEVLRKEIADRKKKQDEAAKKKAKNQLATKQKALEKAEIAATPPDDFFKKQGYTKFDDKGMPTHDLKGEELGKGPLKKMVKTLGAHKKAHEKLKTDTGGDIDAYLSKLKAEVDAIAATL